MNTSLSTGCTESSSSRDSPGMSPISEPFHGTMTSDFGASWLPRIEMPAKVLASLVFASFAAALLRFRGLLRLRGLLLRVLFLRRVFGHERAGGEQQDQDDRRAQHDSSYLPARFCRSASHFTTSGSSGALRRYAS